jgi:ribosomal protein S18 acetylase RimI-like enzyme
MVMNSEDILHVSDLNLTEFIREMARWNVESEIFEQNDLVLTKGPGNSPVTNVAINLSNATDHSTHVDRFDRIRSFYRQRKSGFSIHIRKHVDEALESICKQENLFMIANAPGMMIDRPFPQKTTPQEIEIRPITTVAGVVDFAFVSTQSYQSLGMPSSIGDMIFASPGRLLRPYNYIVVAYEADRPVSAAMLMFSHSIAGIYWVGTIENARGRGLAEACVSAVTNEAFRRGVSLVVLQASKFGEPIYRRMGFTEFTRYPWYMWFEK